MTFQEHTMLKLTPPQNRLIRRLIAQPDGIDVRTCHDMTLTGLVRRGLVTIEGGQVRLTAPTRQIRNGTGVRTVLALDAVEVAP
jgi:hypothetical protein